MAALTEVVKLQTHALDGFAGYTDLVAGKEDQYRPAGGAFIQFNQRAPQWTFNDGVSLPPDREYIAFNVGREVVKWPPGAEKGAPVDRKILAPHELFPDIEQMNESTPKSDWRIDLNDNLVGPWQTQHVLYLIDLVSTQRLIFPTRTQGGHVAVSQLVLLVNDRRELTKVPNLVAVVLLQDKLFSPKYGTRRPHFEPVRFQPFGPTEQRETLALTDNTATDVELPPRTVTMKDEIPH
jgi:hypothetical protein